jgi:hypothetical protein
MLVVQLMPLQLSGLKPAIALPSRLSSSLFVCFLVLLLLSFVLCVVCRVSYVTATMKARLICVAAILIALAMFELIFGGIVFVSNRTCDVAQVAPSPTPTNSNLNVDTNSNSNNNNNNNNLQALPQLRTFEEQQYSLWQDISDSPVTITLESASRKCHTWLVVHPSGHHSTETYRNLVTNFVALRQQTLPTVGVPCVVAFDERTVAKGATVEQLAIDTIESYLILLSTDSTSLTPLFAHSKFAMLLDDEQQQQQQQQQQALSAEASNSHLVNLAYLLAVSQGAHEIVTVPAKYLAQQASISAASAKHDDVHLCTPILGTQPSSATVFSEHAILDALQAPSSTLPIKACLLKRFSKPVAMEHYVVSDDTSGTVVCSAGSFCGIHNGLTKFDRSMFWGLFVPSADGEQAEHHTSDLPLMIRSLAAQRILWDSHEPLVVHVTRARRRNSVVADESSNALVTGVARALMASQTQVSSATLLAATHPIASDDAQNAASAMYQVMVQLYNFGVLNERDMLLAKAFMLDVLSLSPPPPPPPPPPTPTPTPPPPPPPPPPPALRPASGKQGGSIFEQLQPHWGGPLKIWAVSREEVPQHFLMNNFDQLDQISHNQYMLPIYFWERCLVSPNRVEDQLDADIIVVPLNAYATLPWQNRNPPQDLWPSYLQYLKQQPAWGRKKFFIQWSHVYGGPGASGEEMRPHSIFASPEMAVWIRAYDFIVPYSAVASQRQFSNRDEVLNHERPGILYFSGRLVGGRDRFLHHFAGRSGYTLLNTNLVGTQDVNNEDAKRTLLQAVENFRVACLSHKFCLAGAGDVQTSRRTYEVLMAGCIPVIMTHNAETMDLPFEEMIDWREFSIILKPNADLNALQELMENMPAQELKRRQLAMHRVHRAFYFETDMSIVNDPKKHQPDMFDYMMQTLNSRLHIIRREEQRNIDRTVL